MRCSLYVGWHSYLTHLECSACGARHGADQPQTVCTRCGLVLFARYDLPRLRSEVRPADLAGRRWNMWRYHELLPVRDEANVISLGEGATPVLTARGGVASRLGFERGAVRVKDEGQNPTASYPAPV